jgi:hypothetical protein
MERAPLKMFSQNTTRESNAKTHQAITCKLRVSPGLQQSFRLSCNRCVQQRFASFEARAKVFSRPAPFISALHFFPRVVYLNDLNSVVKAVR